VRGPVLLPPCIRQRPFRMPADRQGVPLRVLALHLGALFQSPCRLPFLSGLQGLAVWGVSVISGAAPWSYGPHPLRRRQRQRPVRLDRPAGSRQHFGALLLGYYTEDGRLLYAGRAGTGFTDLELKRLAGVLLPLEMKRMPLDKPPPRETRFGSPLELSRVHWVRPEVVVEVTYLNWTEGGLLRAVSYQGQREDKPARQVIRSIPHRVLAQA
jgi:ATP dependent DNA ligase-like protein